MLVDALLFLQLPVNETLRVVTPVLIPRTVQPFAQQRTAVKYYGSNQAFSEPNWKHITERPDNFSNFSSIIRRENEEAI